LYSKNKFDKLVHLVGFIIRNYHYSRRNNPEERSCHLIRGGSLKSRKGFILIYKGYCLFKYADVICGCNATSGRITMDVVVADFDVLSRHVRS
jgi:hypothetical protein